MMGQRTGFRRAWGRAMSLAALLAGLCLPSVALAYTTNNEGLELVPFTINVHNRFPFHLFVYIHGITEKHTATLPPSKAVYVSNVQGDVLLTPVISAGSLGLDLGTATTTTIMLPKLVAMRVYFSINNPLLVSSGQQGIVPDILGGGWTPSGANYNTIFDWLELDWQDAAPNPYHLATRFGGNATQVDMFGFPMFLDMTGTDPATGLPSSFLDNYINSVWSYYATNTMYASAENVNFSGRVQNGNLVFTEAGTSIAKFQFSKPTTFNVFLNEIYTKNATLLDPSTAGKAGVVAAYLGGAFMRTVLLVNTDLMACDPSQFYNDPTSTNKYAKLWHQYAWLNLAYAYGYDDTCSQSSYFTVGDPTGFTVHVLGN